MRALAATLAFCFSTFAFADEKVNINVELTPAGEFTIKGDKVDGKLTKSGDGFTAKEIKVGVTTLKTGISLRDKHMRERLGKTISVKNIKVSGGRGKGLMTINNVTKPVSFDVKDNSNGTAEAKFKLLLNDFGIKGVRYMNVGVQDEIEGKVIVPYN